MTAEAVRMWRPGGEDRLLLMAGRTADYAMQPRGEYVFGVVQGEPMRSRRARERRLIAPGHLVAWDPSEAHAGTAVAGRRWTARLMVIDGTRLSELAADGDQDAPPEVAFPDPVIRDPALIEGFLSLHGALAGCLSRLEREVRLAQWLRALTERAASVRPPPRRLGERDASALRRACDYLADQPGRNIGLDELAAAAGIGKFRLIRLFRDRTGLTPHAWQVAHRIRTARGLLEAGHSIAAAAAAAGFADQSHLHRHFRRGLGVTPAEYQRRFGVRPAGGPRPRG